MFLTTFGDFKILLKPSNKRPKMEWMLNKRSIALSIGWTKTWMNQDRWVNQDFWMNQDCWVNQDFWMKLDCWINQDFWMNQDCWMLNSLLSIVCDIFSLLLPLPVPTNREKFRTIIFFFNFNLYNLCLYQRYYDKKKLFVETFFYIDFVTW